MGLLDFQIIAFCFNLHFTQCPNFGREYGLYENKDQNLCVIICCIFGYMSLRAVGEQILIISLCNDTR